MIGGLKLPTPYLSRLKLEKELEKKAKTLRVKKEKCEKLFSEIEDKMGFIGDFEDVEDFKKVIKEAREVYEIKDFDKALEKLEDLDKKIGDRIEDIFIKEKEKIEKAINMLEDVDLTKIKVDLKEAEEKIKEDPKGSFDILTSIEKRIGDEISDEVSRKKTEIIENTSKIGGIKGIEERIKEIEELEGINALIEIQKIEEEVKNNVKEKIDEYLKKSKNLIEIAVSAHFNLPYDKSVEDRIWELFKSKNYSAAIKNAEEYYNNIKKSFEIFFRKLFDISQRIIEEGKGMDIDVSSSLENIKDAEKYYNEGDFEKAVDTIREVTENAEKLKFQKVIDLIKKAREELLEAKSGGVDISEYLKKIDGARNFLKIGRYKKAYDIVLDTMNMMERRKNLYSQLKQEIKSIKELIEDLRKEEIILEGVDERIKIIEEEVEKNAEEAESMMDDLKDSIKMGLREIAQGLYDDIMGSLGKMEEEKVNVEDIKMEIENIKTLLNNENYKDAITSLREVEVSVFNRANEFMDGQLKKMKKYKDERIERGIDEIKKSLNSGDIGASFDKFKELKEIAFEIEGKKYVERISNIKDQIEYVRKAGGNVTEVISYIERAETFLKKKDIVMVEEYIKKAEDAFESLQSLIAKEIFDSAKTMAATAKKTGVNIAGAGIMNLLKIAKESIEKEDYKKAIEYSQQARKSAKELRDRAEKAYSQLVNAAKRVAKLKEMGADVSSIAKLLVDAKHNFERNAFDKAEELSIKCIKESEKIENKAKIEYLRREIDNLGKVLRELGLNQEFKSISKDFYDRYEELRHENLPEIGERTMETLREQVETILTDYIGKIETDLYDAKEKGYNIAINPEDLENAKDLFIKRRYIDSLTLLKKLEKEIGKVYERNEKIKELKERIKKTLDAAMSLGIDISPYKDRVNNLATISDVEKVEEEGNRIVKEVEKSINKKVRTLIQTVERELDKLRRKGEDITAAENILNKAKASLNEKRYADAVSRTIASMGEIEKYEMQKNTAYGILKRIEVKIKAMKNILPRNVTKEYEYAKKLFLKGLYEQSIERSMSVSDKISNIERIIEHIKERNKQIREIVMKVHRLGMDVKNVLKLFNEAKEEFTKLNYEKSLKIVDQCHTEAKLLLIDAINKYKGVYSRMLTLIKRLNLESEFRDEISEIDSLFEKGEFESIKVKLSELKKELDKRLEIVSEDIMKEFKEKKKIFSTLRIDVGMDLENVEKKMREIKAKDYSRFFEYSYTINEKLEKYMPVVIKKKMDNFKEKLERYENYGVNVDEYHSKLSEILSMMEEKEYNEIFKMLEDVDNNFEKYINEYVKTLIERMKKRVSEYSEEKATEFGERMEKMRNVGNYIEAIRIYEEANNFAARYKVFLEDFGKKVEEVKDRLRFGLSLGLKLGDQIAKLKDIEEVATRDMDKARLELENLKSEINARIDSLSPEIEIEFEIGKKMDGKYGGKLKVINKGNVDAQNIKIEIRGALKSEKPINILKVDKNSEESQDILLLKDKGDKVKISATYSRFDGKEYSITKEVKVEIKEKGYHIEKAKEKVKCTLCRGTILPGMDVLICDNCGATYHVPCAKRLGKCKKCGQKFEFD